MHVDICNNILQVSPYILSSYVESRARANSLCKVPVSYFVQSIKNFPVLRSLPNLHTMLSRAFRHSLKVLHVCIHAERKIRCFVISIGRRSSSDEQGMIKFKHPSRFSDEAIGEDLSSREFSRMGILIMGVLWMVISTYIVIPFWYWSDDLFKWALWYDSMRLADHGLYPRCRSKSISWCILYSVRSVLPQIMLWCALGYESHLSFISLVYEMHKMNNKSWASISQSHKSDQINSSTQTLKSLRPGQNSVPRAHSRLHQLGSRCTLISDFDSLYLSLV